MNPGRGAQFARRGRVIPLHDRAAG